MKKCKPTVRHRVEYAVIRVAHVILSALGWRLAGGLGAALGAVCHHMLRLRRRTVQTNLRTAFPDRNASWVRRVAARANAHFGREMVASIRLADQGAAGLERLTRVVGLPGLCAALSAGRGVVMVTGHFGNWELGGAALAVRGLPLDVIAKRQGNPLFDRFVTDARERLGMRVIDREVASGRALRSLRKGRIVAFLADQDARSAGVFVPFFGRLASTHRGPAVLAVRADVPVFLGLAFREAAGYRIELEELVVCREGGLDAVVRRLTAAFTARLEAAVRREPGQYFWHHRRWKTVSLPHAGRPAQAGALGAPLDARVPAFGTVAPGVRYQLKNPVVPRTAAGTAVVDAAGNDNERSEL